MGPELLECLGNLRRSKEPDTYAANGMCQKRIRAVLSTPVCKCKNQCSKKVTFEELLTTCRTFHSLSSHDQQFLIHTMYASPGAEHTNGLDGNNVTRVRTQWSLYGHEVCAVAFVKLLGISFRRLYKDANAVPDMRRSLDGHPAPLRERPQAAVCDQFFIDLYCSAAEPVPVDLHIDNVEESVAEGAVDNLDCDSFVVHGMGDPLEWDPFRPKHQIVEEVQGQGSTGLPKRELPHGTVPDLYWQFLAYFNQLTHDNKDPPSFSTFRRVWLSKWHRALQFRPASSHACCTTCFELRSKIYNTWSTPAEKYMWARQWRTHLQDQYHDRMVYWSLRHCSRKLDSDVLVVIIDSMDKKKAVWPRYTFDRQPHELDNKPPRPRAVLTAALAHGWCTDLILADDSLHHGASAFCEVLARVLDHVYKMSMVNGRPFPKHLVIQSDNTVAQAKNSLANCFLAHLVGTGKFVSCTLNFLMVGHTHEDVDQLFGFICKHIFRRHRWEVVEDLMGYLDAIVGPHVAQKAEECWVTKLDIVRDFDSWLAPQRVRLYGAFKTRDGFEAPHSFCYKRRVNLLSAERLQVEGQRSAVDSSRAARYAGYSDSNADPRDVFCCVKTYTRDRRLQQAPALVLPADRCALVPTPAPTQALPVAISPERASNLEVLAALYEKEAYGYYRAARSLRALANPVAPTLPPPGWLDEPPGFDAEGLLEPTDNPYFSHLPDTSWNLLVKFHRL